MSPFFRHDREIDENGNPVGPPPMRPPMRRDDGPPPPPMQQVPPPPPMMQQAPPMPPRPAQEMPEPPTTEQQGPPPPPQQQMEAPPQMAIGSAAPPEMSMGPPQPPRPQRIQTQQTDKLIQDAQRVQQEKPKWWQQALGAALSISPRTRGIDVHPNITRHRQELGTQQMLADEERKGQVAQSTADWHHENAALTAEQRATATAQRGEAARLKAKPSPQSSAERWNEVKDDETLTDLQKAYYRYTGKLPPAGTAGGRELASNIMTREQMAEAEALGMKFPDLNGDLWTSADLPQGTGIHRRADGAYEPNALPQHTVTTDNRTHVVNKFNQDKLGGSGSNPEQPTYIGDARTGSSGQHEVAGVDAQGNPTTSTYTRSSRPYSGPIRGMVPPIQKAPANAPSGSPRAPAQPRQTPPQGQAQPPGGNRRINFTPANREAQLANIRPLKEIAAQLFPDKGVGLADFADLADDPGARQRTGKFLGLISSEMNNAETGGHAGVSIGPVSLSPGGVGDLLSRWGHVPGGIQEQKVKMMEDALSAMTQRERDYVNIFLSSKSAATGMRKATGGLATNSSIAALEKDLPYLSMNVLNKRDYINKMANMARIVGTGLQGYSPELTDIGSPGTHQRIQGLHDQLMSRMNGGSPSPQRNNPPQQPGANDMVDVIAPDGTPGSIPRANLQKAIARGYKAAR